MINPRLCYGFFVIGFAVNTVTLAGTSISIGGIQQSGSNNRIVIGGSGNVVTSGVSGSGKQASVSRTIAKFNQVVSSLSADVIFRPAPRYQVVLQGDDNILPLITTEVKNRQLILSAKDSYSTRNDISITVFAPFISRFEGNGAGDIQLHDLQADTLALFVSGSSDLVASGRVAELNVHLRGSGDLDLKGLRSKTCSLELEGSGDIAVFASSTFSGTIAGSGDVSIYGSPGKVTQNVTGSGEFTIE